jgi:3-methyladenine DNA glycosylase/8-oxoguanine DNA glycosylase
MSKKSQKLKYRKELEIFPTSPFDFDSTFFKPAHFPSNDIKWQSGKRWQTMLWPSFAQGYGRASPSLAEASAGKQRQRLGLIYENAGTKFKPKVKVRIFSQKSLSKDFLESLKQEIIWRFDLNLDLAGFYKDVGKDLLLAPAIKRLSGMRPMHNGSLYEFLIIAIVLQNTVVKRSISMLQTLFERYGDLLEYSNQKLWCCWDPKVLAKADEQDLRNLKVGYRAKSLIRASQPFANKEINELELRNKDREEQEKVLISLYGAGPASVGYIMFDVFHHWDYLCHISPWEQKIYTRIFFDKDHTKQLVPVSKMLKRFEKWGRWKALAVHYLWEDLWWQHRKKPIEWLVKEIRA